MNHIEPPNVKPANEPSCPNCGSDHINSPYWHGAYRGCYDCGHAWQVNGGRPRISKPAQDAAEKIIHLLGVGHVNDITHYIQQAITHELTKIVSDVLKERTSHRLLLDELGKAAEPFKQMADKFDVEPYRNNWPDSTRIAGNDTIDLHNFLTLGDCRKIKAALTKYQALNTEQKQS